MFYIVQYAIFRIAQSVLHCIWRSQVKELKGESRIHIDCTTQADM